MVGMLSLAKDLITFSHDSHLHVTHENIESQVNLKIQVTLNSNVLQMQNKLNKIIKIVCMYLLMYLMHFDNS